MQSTLTGDLESGGTVTLGQAHDTLSGAESVEDTVVEQTLHKEDAERAGCFSLFEAPLRVAHLESDMLRGQVLVDSMTLSRACQTRMYGFEFVLVLEPSGGLAEAHIEALADESPGGGVATVVDFYMAVAV